jgi:probable O-glycosylation ligase (exosortase A-associated)
MRSLVLSLFLLGLFPTIFLHPYIGVLIYSWISFMSPHRLVFGGMILGLPLALIAAVATLLSWCFSKEPKRLRFDATVWLILAFAVVISISTSLALYPARAAYQWSQVMKELLFVLVTIGLTTNRVRAHALLWVMAVSIGFYGLHGGVGSLVNGGDARVYGPPNTAIFDNNDIGAGLLVALPLMNYVRMQSAHKWIRLGWLFVMACSFLAIVSTYSRGALLGLVAVSIFLSLKSRTKIVTSAIVLTTLVSALAFMPGKYGERIRTIQTYQQDGSAMARIQIWGVATRIALDHPLLGGGFGVTESTSVVHHYAPGFDMHAVHNIFLGVLAEHGFIGLIIWLCLLLVGWRNTRRIQQSSMNRPEWQWASDFARMCQVSLVGYCVVGSFGNYEYWDYYFTILGLLAAIKTMIERATVPQRFRAAVAAAARHPAPQLSIDSPNNGSLVV